MTDRGPAMRCAFGVVIGESLVELGERVRVETVEHLGWCSHRKQPTTWCERHYLVAAFDVLDAVRGEYHGASLGAHSMQAGNEISGGQGVQAARRLVQETHARLGEDL